MRRWNLNPVRPPIPPRLRWLRTRLNHVWAQLRKATTLCDLERSAGSLADLVHRVSERGRERLLPSRWLSGALEGDATTLLDGCLLDSLHLALQVSHFRACCSVSLDEEQGRPEDDNTNRCSHGITGGFAVLGSSGLDSSGRDAACLFPKLRTGVARILNRRDISCGNVFGF